MASGAAVLFGAVFGAEPVAPGAAGLCFLDFVGPVVVVVLESGAVAEVSDPLAVAEGAVVIDEDEDPGGLLAGGIAVVEPGAEALGAAPVAGLFCWAVGSSGTGWALAAPVAPPRAVPVWAKAAGETARTKAAAPTESIVSFMVGFLFSRSPAQSERLPAQFVSYWMQFRLGLHPRAKTAPL